MNKTIYDWLTEYNQYHKNETNKAIHWICIPLIIFSLFGLLNQIPLSYQITYKTFTIQIDAYLIFIIIVTLFYLRLSMPLAFGMLIISILLKLAINQISLLPFQINFHSYLYSSIFIIAWVGQFLGHKIEGEKPAFFKDLQFLLIGPLWQLSFIYNKLNIKI